MQIDYTQPLEQWLDSVPALAEAAIEAYKKESGQQSKNDEFEVDLKALARWLYDSFGGDIGPNPEKVITPRRFLYLVPAVNALEQKMLFTEAVNLIGYPELLVPNPDTCPNAARRTAAYNRQCIARSFESQEVVDDLSDFEEDVTGAESGYKPLSAATATTTEQAKNDVLAAINITTSKDLDSLLEQAAGVSLLADASIKDTPKPRELYKSVLAMTSKRDIDVELAAPKTAKIIREVVKQAPGERHDLDDRKARRQAERSRKENELDGFGGMTRKRITPEIRQDLQAIKLRGFVDPKKHYRSAKHDFELADAESGFFDIGYVVAGGLHDRPIAADGSTFVTIQERKKKPKTIVRDLLDI